MRQRNKRKTVTSRFSEVLVKQFLEVNINWSKWKTQLALSINISISTISTDINYITTQLYQLISTDCSFKLDPWSTCPRHGSQEEMMDMMMWWMLVCVGFLRYCFYDYSFCELSWIYRDNVHIIVWPELPVLRLLKKRSFKRSQKKRSPTSHVE